MNVCEFVIYKNKIKSIKSLDYFTEKWQPMVHDNCFVIWLCSDRCETSQNSSVMPIWTFPQKKLLKFKLNYSAFDPWLTFTAFWTKDGKTYETKKFWRKNFFTADNRNPSLLRRIPIACTAAPPYVPSAKDNQCLQLFLFVRQRFVMNTLAILFLDWRSVEHVRAGVAVVVINKRYTNLNIEQKNHSLFTFVLNRI